jgi:UDP-2,3-diacylglucosamine pyrophosphatase LpxH
MITDVREERLLVTSDAHVGSLFCDARRRLIKFLEYARANGYNAVINGDGIDTEYTTLRAFTAETSALMRDLGRITADITVYYTVGNHDILLEHYVGDWGRLHLVPFLNVTSGRSRIRIEHGHLYDPSMMTNPNLHHGVRQVLCLLCRMYPPFYFWHEKFQRLQFRYLRRLLARDPHLLASPASRDISPAFLEAAEELAQRGFDEVVFGHTHYAGELPLNRNRSRYMNTGSWFRDPHFVTIDRGEVTLAPLPPALR